MSVQVLCQNISEKASLISLPKIGWRRFFVFCFSSVIFLLVFYIFQINELTKAGFFASKYEQEISKLSKESKDLETALSQDKSLANLENILKELDYEKIGRIHYLRVLGETALAK